MDRPLRALLARRLSLLLQTENMLRECSEFVPEVLPSMIGEDAAANFSDLVAKRRAYAREQIAILARQDPKYTEDIERILLMWAASRREMTQYRRLHEGGIVGAELLRDLMPDLQRRRRKLDRPPSLDFGFSPVYLVDHVPLFEALSGEQKRAIAVA